MLLDLDKMTDDAFDVVVLGAGGVA